MKIIINESQLKYIIENKKKMDFKKEHNIKEIECGLVWSESEQKYYGWSHRAYYGFGIGSKVKKGDVGYNGKEWIAKNMNDAKQMAIDYRNNIS